VKEKCRERLPEDLLAVVDRFRTTLESAQAMLPQDGFLTE
jgi:hypothetical protein